MPETHRFSAPIVAADKGGAFVTVPFDVEAALGSRRPKIVSTFDGEPYRGSLAGMGGPDHILIVRKHIRETIGKQPGDVIDVTVALDDQPRTVPMPDDLAAALTASGAREAFDALSYTRRKEHVAAIEGARPHARGASRRRSQTCSAHRRPAPPEASGGSA